MEKTYASLMFSVVRNILEDCESRLPDLKILCRDREVLHTHKSLMMLFPVLGASLAASPETDTVILDSVKKTSLQAVMKMVSGMNEEETHSFDSDILQLMNIHIQVNCGIERKNLNYVKIDPESPLTEIERNEDEEDNCERNKVINERPDRIESFENLEDHDMVEEDAHERVNYSEIRESNQDEEFNNVERIEDGDSMLVDDITENVTVSPETLPDVPDDTSIDSLLEDSDEEKEESPPRDSQTKSCPFLNCMKKWKCGRYGYHGNQLKKTMKNHILKVHYENEFTRLLNSSFTAAGKCRQCKNKLISGRLSQKKHLREAHNVLEDEIAPLMEAAFPSRLGRPSLATMEDSPLPGESEKEKSLMLEELQSKLEYSDSSDEDEETQSEEVNTAHTNTNTSSRNLTCTIDYSDSDDD